MNHEHESIEAVKVLLELLPEIIFTLKYYYYWLLDIKSN
jgi:hypothetical protein